MQVLITYDVETITSEGKKRLRQVSKVCVDYGQRVQNSVFELNIYQADLLEIKNKLIKIIDPQKDSIRIYNLGKNWERRVETLGKDDSYNPEKDLLML
ncbi:MULTISPECIES: CRISPR-associated endonuclease Cas2 [Peptoniphilus]|jgi:CRISPR-associated endoribonuclease cas2|uniref:CRISPR-associated endonuclease Cas2 n=1 Tax=Peptoniphilus TaxID=162289 RepID=UPI00028919F5|nr:MULTISPECIES: CRISPR-associated endonuclease Cas2 [Peptoniphilus]MBS6610791.1 CRISPR-associated endonuclease Cas2 [Peptoniphilus harei]MDU1043193.1 CRISPR-associated endonuclease Cas2 [Peptoniphilus rhinitidis]MDU1954912.1 CRISPR-associated endonuclease Cas2 [Peptoniphilus lacydonensis]MDU2110083.1 CRISPR-associated endonuclease Cas2 [Peptoniphilus lacydonensis]MDU2114925.1 CRISPR-associated endonuclease Cas2 [Peptoniphilus lacydonensis]